MEIPDSPSGEESPPEAGKPPEEELAVMRLMVAGLTDRTIARHLGLSVTTVRRRARRFCNRMEASTRIEATAAAIRRGWL